MLFCNTSKKIEGRRELNEPLGVTCFHAGSSSHQHHVSTLNALNMKKSFPAILALAVSLLGLASNTTSAQLLVYEGFDYTTGQPVNTLNGGTGWSDAWHPGINNATDFWQTNAGTAGFQNPTNTGALETSGGYAGRSGTGNAQLIRTFSVDVDRTTNSDVWFSFLIQDATVDFFGSNDSTTDAKMFGFDARSAITMGGATTLSDDATGFSTVSGSSREATLIVGRVDLVASGGTMEFWFNPELGGASPANADYTSGSLSLTNNLTELTSFGFFSRPSNAADPSFDEFRLGTSFSDVTPIPEPTSGTLILMAGTLGALLVWRRR